MAYRMKRRGFGLVAAASTIQSTVPETVSQTTPPSPIDFPIGVWALFNPSAWSGVFQGGNPFAIAGFLSIPAIVLFFMTKGKG